MPDLVVPQLGESITEAVVAKWLKQVGDAVAVDEPVAELETDKITVQLPAPAAGALAEQKVKEGATVKVGDVIGSIEAGAAGKTKPAEKAAPVAAKSPTTPPPAIKPAQAQSAPTHVVLVQAPTTPGIAVPASGGNGQPAPNLDKDALLRLTPSQRVHAREAGSLPARTASTPA